MDAAVYLAAENGIVLDVCVFHQWAGALGFQRPDCLFEQFTFNHARDFNVYSFSLRNLDLQRAYVQTLARRWRRAGNILYNLANETYIKAPDASQMDPEAQQWEGIPREPGIRRDTLLYRRWADEMAQVIPALRAAASPCFPAICFR